MTQSAGHRLAKNSFARFNKTLIAQAVALSISAMAAAPAYAVVPLVSCPAAVGGVITVANLAVNQQCNLGAGISLDVNNTGGAGSFNISNGTAVGVNGVTAGNITNSGTIYGRNYGINLTSGSSVGSITNNAGGTISSSRTAIYIRSNSAVTSITNNGTISSYTSYGIGVSSSHVGSITNNGTITTDWNGAIDINNSGIVDSITNNGLITATGANWSAGKAIELYSNGSIGSLTNSTSGIISGAGNQGVGIRLSNGSSIGSITNNGVITGGAFGIDNGGTITTLNNAQGGNSATPASTALTYTGALPTNYNIIIKSTTQYGQLAVTSGTGNTVFGIATGSTAISNHTYTSVLSGITTTQLGGTGTTINGASNGYTFSLLETGVGTDIWNLDILTAPVSGSAFLGSAAKYYGGSGAGASVVLGNLVANGSSDAGMTQVLTALGNLTTEQQTANAVQQTLPLMTGSMPQIEKSTLRDIGRVVQARQEANAGLSSGDAFLGDKEVWFKPLGSWTNQDNRKGTPGFSADTYGGILGLDGVISDQARIGVAFAYTHTNVDTNNAAVAPQSAGINSYQGIVYGSYSLNDRTELSLQADYGQNNNKGSRTINFGGLNGVASSNYDGWSGHMGAGLSRNYEVDSSTTVTPVVRIDYTHLHNEGYVETGAGALNLNVGSNNADELILMAEGRAAHTVTEHAKVLMNLGVGYDTLAHSNNVITAAYTGGGAAFSTLGIDQSPVMVRGGAGVVINNSKALEITARYDFELRSNFNNQTASVKFKLPF